MDACDAIMDKVGRPRGLIRYATQDALAGKPPRLLRPRVVLYPIALTLFLVGGYGLLPLAPLAIGLLAFTVPLRSYWRVMRSGHRRLMGRASG